MTTEATSSRRDQQHLATTAVPEIKSGAAQLLCRAGKQYYAVPIEHVIEVMRALPVEPIAEAPHYVRGLAIIRGRPVPVVDVGLLLGGQPAKSGRFVTIKIGPRTVALHVETAIGIHGFDADTFDQLPPLLRNVATETVADVGTLDSELLITLRAARIVPEKVFAYLDRDGAKS